MPDTKELKEKYKKLAFILASHVDNLQRLASTWSEDITKIYEKTEDEVLSLITEIHDLLSKNKISSVTSMTHLRKLKSKLKELRKKSNQEALDFIEKNIEQLIKNEDSWNKAWLFSIFTLFDDKKKKSDIQSLTQAHTKDIRNYGLYNGGTVDEIFEQIYQLDISRLNFLASKPLLNKAKGKENLKEETLKEEAAKAISKTKNQLSVNVFSIVNGISNDTASLFAQTNKKIVQGMMWVTALDESVCDECAALEGVIFDAGKEPFCPAHFNCRCHVVPVTREISDELPRS